MEFVKKKKKKKSLKLGIMPISVTKTEMLPLFAEKKKRNKIFACIQLRKKESRVQLKLKVSKKM